MPVTQGQLAYKPLQPGENPAISDGLKMGIQSAKFAFDGEGLSHITYRFRTVDDPSGTWFSKFGVYVATWAGSAWSEQQIAYVPPERETLPQHWRQPFRGQAEGVFSVEYTSSGNTVAVIVLAENAGSGWVYSVLGNSAPTLLRLGAAPGNGGDVLYVSAPFEAKVYRYFVPEDYSPAQQFTSFDVLLSTLV
ncbi:hypothetical protein LOF13_27970 [Klebsiella pneumoniae subsp. pneumoniae]|nr:hypothetical protein LOF13_27970 [Klebsiella pneumoniae subsp. pneumoniae]